MAGRIGSVTAGEREAPPVQEAARASASPRSDDDPGLARACAEFEGVLVRQLLATCTRGEADRSGYGSMVTDSLASAVGDAGGLGVGEALRRALSEGGRR